MKEYEFTCSECGQEIEVNDNMREAIVTNGCPVCAAAANEEEFGKI
jgi:putative FmdB family regulatory protein